MARTKTKKVGRPKGSTNKKSTGLKAENVRLRAQVAAMRELLQLD